MLFLLTLKSIDSKICFERLKTTMWRSDFFSLNAYLDKVVGLQVDGRSGLIQNQNLGLS